MGVRTGVGIGLDAADGGPGGTGLAIESAPGAPTGGPGIGAEPERALVEEGGGTLPGGPGGFGATTGGPGGTETGAEVEAEGGAVEADPLKNASMSAADTPSLFIFWRTAPSGSWFFFIIVYLANLSPPLVSALEPAMA